MTTTPDNDHDLDAHASALFEDLLCGTRSPSDRDVQAMFKSNPDLHAEYLEMHAMTNALDAAGSEQREDLQRLAAEDLDAAAVDQATALMDKHTKDTPLAPMHSFKTWTILGAAAAACLVAWFVFGRESADPTGGTTYDNPSLGQWAESPRIEDNSDWSQFAWKADAIPEGAEVRIQIRKPGQPLDEFLVDSESMLPGTTQWQPTTDEQIAFGSTIEWRIVLEPRTVFRKQFAWVSLTR